MKHLLINEIGLRKAWMLLTLCMALAMLAPGAAWAQDGSEDLGITAVKDALGENRVTVQNSADLGDGWVLDYEVADGGATITGVVSAPGAVADLSVPEQLGGYDVVQIAEAAFANQKSIGAVTLPETLKIMGKRAFAASSVSSVVLPASLEYVPYRCFWGCTELQSVTFAEGATPEYLGTGAFMKCSKLEEIVIPPLMGYDYDWICETPTTTFSGKGGWRIGFQCFTECSSLKKLVFEAGNPKGCNEYLKDGSGQFGKTADGMEIVNYCKGVTSRYASTAKWYFALNFYESEADAKADTTHSHPWKQLVYESGTPMLDVLKGISKAKPYEGSDELPEMPASDQALGRVWGVSDSGLTSPTTTLNQSYDIYPVDKGNMAYCWVSCPQLSTATDAERVVLPDNGNASYVRLDKSGKVDLSQLAVYAPDGTRVDESLYTFKFELGTQVPRPNSSFYDTKWSDLKSADDVNAEGSYRVRATGSGDFANTETQAVQFSVRRYTSNVSDLTATPRSEATAKASFKAQTDLKSKPKFMVVAPASSWQFSLIGAGLAGVGGGQVVLTEGDETSATAYMTIQSSDVSNIIFLGSEDALTSSVKERIQTNVGRSGSFDAIEGSTPEELSLAVYRTIAKFGPQQATPYDWGDTAVVASAAQSWKTAAVAQYAYQAQAPVFFTAEDGTLSADTLAALKDGSFTSIVVAGSADAVSDEALASIQAATGVAPTRVLDGEGNGFEASKELVGTIQSTFVDDAGEPLNKTGKAVVASALDPAYVIAASQLAAIDGATLYTVASSADLKALEERLAAATGDMTDVIYLVGDFSSISEETVARLASVWSDPLSSALEAGDTVETGGLLFRIDSGSSASLLSLLDTSRTSVEANEVSVGSKRYAVASIVDGAFKDNETIEAFSSTASSIGADAFAHCTALATVDAPSAASLGASAFSGCASLSSATFPSATSLGENAFEGCTSLSQASLPKAAGIGANTFAGCSALKSVTMTSAKAIGESAFKDCKVLSQADAPAAKTVGADAFDGCKALSQAKLPKATSIGESAFDGCKALKSVTVTAAKTIGARAFYGCKALKSVSAKATSIGEKAFMGCTAMTKATLGASGLKAIGASAFSGCRKLASCTISSSALTKIEEYAFKNCTKLSSISIASKKLATIGLGAFMGCSTLKSATFKSTALTTIEAKAFSGCKKLATITFNSKKIKTVGSQALKRLKSNVTVKVPKAKIAAYKKLFKKAGLPSKARLVKA